MSEPKKKLEKPLPQSEVEPKTELPDTKHHYDAKQEALKSAPTSQGDALGAAAQSFQ